MNAAYLIFLNDPDAMRLAMAWSLACKGGKPAKDEDWARVAGVSSLVVNKHGAALRSSGICGDDGKVDDLAVKFIASAALSRMKQPKGKSS